LRPWDAASWLEYGLVLNELGRPEQALEAFEKVIAETREAALPAKVDDPTAIWPVLTTESNQPGLATSGDPEAGSQSEMLRTISDYPHIDSHVQEDIENWLEKNRPEFSRTPGKARDLRLRAIEEAARIHSASPRSRDAWVSRWKQAAEGSPVEALWAFRYSGARDETLSQMRQLLGPMRDPVARFLFSVVALRVGGEEALIQWANETEVPGMDAEPIRKTYPLLALLAILRQPDSMADEELLPDQIEKIAGSISLTPAVTAYVFEAMRDENRDAAALAFGRALIEQSPRDNGELMLAMASVAGRLGRDADRSEWLRRCVDSIQPRSGSGLPYYYFQAVSERYNDLESAAEKASLLRELRDRFEDSSSSGEAVISVTDVVKTENRALLALIVGDGDEAVREVRKLVELHLNRTRPRTRNDQNESFPQIEGWAQLERILNVLAARRPATIDTEAFFSALEPDLVADPRNLEAVSQYEQFEMELICWKLEHLTPAQRERELQFLYARLRDPGSRLQLARTLESRGLHREAIPIYQLSIDESPDDISPARGFFSACLKSREYRPALEVIEAYLSGERRQPPGMAGDFLYRQHAEFLFMAGDLETLTARALGGAAANPNLPKPANAPPGFVPNEVLDNSIYYQSALVRAQERRGNDEAMLRVLAHLRDSGRITKEERLLAGRAALRRGDRAGAMEWLSGIALDQQQAVTEIEAIRELAALYATATPPDRTALGDLGRICSLYSDLSVTREVAERLFAAGAATEGRGVLLLTARDR
ncbi:MAG: hypothetical protein KDM64_11865, partial [Verrucomicrobiae bacterium]|nr:hypothetical protein [Verrucomicrobiae bacterium]